MAFRKGDPKTGGRQKGTPNKFGAELKEAILRAATEAGGEGGLVGYLKGQALTNPGPFMGLLGKVLPHEVAAQVTHEHNFEGTRDELSQLLDRAVEREAAVPGSRTTH